MAYSKYAIEYTSVSVQAILLAIGVAAIAAGLLAARYRFSPWWLLAGASLAAVPIYIVARHETSRSCDSLRGTDILPPELITACLIASLLLYGAAAVAAVAGGIRQAQADGARGEAV